MSTTFEIQNYYLRLLEIGYSEHEAREYTLWQQFAHMDSDAVLDALNEITANRTYNLDSIIPVAGYDGPTKMAEMSTQDWLRYAELTNRYSPATRVRGWCPKCKAGPANPCYENCETQKPKLIIE